MKTELKEISPTKRQIDIEIDAESLKASYGRVSKRYADRANVPGFRKGYAPLDIVRMRFKEEIKSEVLQDVVPAKVAEAIREHELSPLGEPHLHLDDHENISVNGSQPLKLEVHVDVMPEIPTPSIDGIEVKRMVRPVDETEVDDLIQRRLEGEAAFVPVEGRASEIGDTVIVDLSGKFDDKPDADPITAEDLEIELGGGNIEESFTTNLVGLNEDEEKDFTVEYPADFSSTELAGKTVHYTAKVKSIGKREVPEANDDWAKSLGEGYESLDELKKRLRADLEKVAEADADSRVNNEAIGKMIEKNSFEVPGILIENQARNLLNDFARDVQQRGMDLKQLDESFIQMMYGNMQQQAARDVQGSLLLDKIAEAEGVTVGDSEIDDEIAKLADYYRTPPDEIRKAFEANGGIDNIRNNLRNRKAVDAIVAKVKVIDAEWVEPGSKPIVEKADETADEEKKPAKKKSAAKAKKKAD